MTTGKRVKLFLTFNELEYLSGCLYNDGVMLYTMLDEYRAQGRDMKTDEEVLHRRNQIKLSRALDNKIMRKLKRFTKK